MNKLNIDTLTDQQIVDSRGQLAIQAGHIPGSLNLTPGNFKKFAHNYLTQDQAIVFVVEDDSRDSLDELSKLTEELGYTHVEGYITTQDIQDMQLRTLETITAKEFLALSNDYILLDVRNPAEITRHAPKPNLTTIPFEDLVDQYQNLDASKTIYTLCGSGNRGTAAATFLSNKGLNPVVIEGGMKAIKEENQA